MSVPLPCQVHPLPNRSPLPLPTHTFSLLYSSHLPSISDPPSTFLLCHPHLFPSIYIPIVSSPLRISLPPTPFRPNTPIGPQIHLLFWLPTNFLPTLTLLALSLQTQYINLFFKPLLPAATRISKLFPSSFSSISIISLPSRYAAPPTEVGGKPAHSYLATSTGNDRLIRSVIG